MKKLLIFGLCMFMGLGFLTINAANPAAYNIITNVGADMAHEVNINWHSDVLDTYVEYTIATDTNYANKKVVQGEYREFKKPTNVRSVNGFNDRYIVGATLTNLTPNTQYKYRVGKDGDFSKDYYFVTAHEGTFSFLHITDPQYASQSQANVFNNLMTKAYTINPNIAFTFFTGDVTDHGGDENQWKMFYNASNISRNTVAVVPGNHEYYDAQGSGEYTDEFVKIGYNHPKNGVPELPNTNYYFRYYDTLFVGINTEAKSQLSQRQWFEEIMMANHDAKFVIVGMHRSMYGSTYASDSVAVRSNWQNLFDRYGVDLVLSGHDHVYARSYIVYNDQVTTTDYRGTVYIIGGYGGEKKYGAIPNPKYAKVVEFTSVANIITVSETGININLINLNGETLDTLETPIKSKRVGEVDPNFTKEAFEEGITVTQKRNDLGVIAWPKNNFGNVISISLYDETDKALRHTLLYNGKVENAEFNGIWTNRLNNFKVVVSYKDGTSSTLNYTIDTRIPDPKKTIVELMEIMKEAFNNRVKGIFNE